MQQNPFSLYDFLGHLIPGVFFIFVVTFVFKIEYSSYFDILKFDTTTTLYNTILIVVFVVCAYIVGQFLSFISSRTIETYSNFKYRYPSVFLLSLKWDDKNEHSLGLKTIRLIIRIIIFHVYIVDKFISYFFGFIGLIDKPLDKSMKRTVVQKINKLFDKLNLDKDIRINNKTNVTVDFNRIVMHYVFEYSQKHQSKLNNYVALYGFHRSMSLIFNISAWFFFIFIFTNLNIENIQFYLIAYVSCIAISYLFFISFMKFYRRFTLESFMVLVIDKGIE